MHRRATGFVSVFVLVVVFGLASFRADASPVLNFLDGTLTVTGFFSSSESVLDVRGALGLNLVDQGVVLGPVVIVDSTGGTDPTGEVLPFGNRELLAVDWESLNTLVTADLLFDFDHATRDEQTLVVPVWTKVSAPGGDPGPGLALLIYGSPAAFRFTLSDFVDFGDGEVAYQWQFDSISPRAVPEPGSLVMLLSGALVFAACRRRPGANRLSAGLWSVRSTRG